MVCNIEHYLSLMLIKSNAMLKCYSMSINSANAKTIEQELNWFQKLVMLRGKITFEQSLPEDEINNLQLPSVENQNSAYATLIKKHSMGMEERLELILALISHVKPSLLDLLHMKNVLY